MRFSRRARPAQPLFAAAMVVATLLIPALSFGLLLSGASAQVEDAAEARSQTFQPVEGAVQEDIAGGPLLVATYATIWVVLFLYVVRLVRLQGRTQQELEGLRAELERGDAPGG
ncbi:MAG: CcmD family protein [Myxococcales bacterium]|nr:CcmD family protein [Myxococcales bacterium]